MILPGHIIQEYVNEGLISVQPRFDEQQLRPFGLRIHLGTKLLVPKANQLIDLSMNSTHEPVYETVNLDEKPYRLRSGDFVLGSTIESFKLDSSLMLRLDGRSTVARLGLMIYCASTIVDGNHLEYRSIVLELKNIGPFDLVIPSGLAIGMVTFEKVVGEASLELEHKQYRGQVDVLPPNLNFKIAPYNS